MHKHSLIADVVRCPRCGGALDERFACKSGHSYAVQGDVPVLVAGFDDTASSIRDSFGREWDYFRHGVDRTWGAAVSRRRQEFLDHVALSEADLSGLRVLDAGCGNGMLSAAVSELGCGVVACDLSGSVHHAARYFADRPIAFVQADLMHHPFRPGSFDVVYCAGVVHHTSDSRVTFSRVAETVGTAGRLFIWVYQRLPGLKQRLRIVARSAVAKAPEPARHLVAVAAAAERFATGRSGLSWHELLVEKHDFWTPRYRWVHTESEVCGWFESAGFRDVRVTVRGVEGFGVLGER